MECSKLLDTPSTSARNSLELEPNNSSTLSETELTTLLQKRKYVLEELLKTETDYVHDLSQVVNGYMKLMVDPNFELPLPDELQGGKLRLVFGNIEQIYEWHRDTFLLSLEEAVAEPRGLGSLFKKHEWKLLKMYVFYCQKKPLSEAIVADYLSTYFESLRQKLNHKLTLPDLLIKPVQRITKYQLLLKDILRYTATAGIEEEVDALKQALNVMNVVPKEANNMMNVGRLQGFEGPIASLGKLILHGSLSCSEMTSGGCCGKKKKYQVFFFQQNIIFSDIAGKTTEFANPVYLYKSHIQVNKMTMEDNTEEIGNWKFTVHSTDPSKQFSYICEAPTKEIHKEWVFQLRIILQTQNNFLFALEKPIDYQQMVSKSSSAPELTSEWSSFEEEFEKRLSQNSSNEDISSTTKSEKGTKGQKKKFLNEICNTFLARNQKKSNDGDAPRRWSDNNAQIKAPPPEAIIPLPPGSTVKVLTDFCAIQQNEISVFKGETVTVLGYSETQGYQVRRCNTGDEMYEGRVPMYVVQRDLCKLNRKPWSFRFRRPSIVVTTDKGKRKISLTSKRPSLHPCDAVDDEEAVEGEEEEGDLSG